MANIPWKKIQGIIQKEAIGPIGENETVTLTEPDSSLFDSGNPQDGPGTSPTTHIVKAVVVPIVRDERRPDAMDLSRGNVTIFVSGLLTVEPAVGWQATVSGIVYRIIDVTVTRPGSTVLLYKIIAGR